MDLLYLLFSSVASLLTLYMFLCLIRVFLTWVPSLAYSAFGRLLAQITDPWLNIFRKYNPMKRYGVDISPVFAFAVLMIVSNILQQISSSRTFSIGIILSIIINIAWSVISSLLTFFNVIVAIRLVASLLNKNQGQIWQSIDHLLSPIIRKLSSIIAKNRFLKQQHALLLLLITGIALQYGVGFLITYLSFFLA